jgi:hypothetical protein
MSGEPGKTDTGYAKIVDGVGRLTTSSGDHTGHGRPAVGYHHRRVSIFADDRMHAKSSSHRSGCPSGQRLQHYMRARGRWCARIYASRKARLDKIHSFSTIQERPYDQETKAPTRSRFKGGQGFEKPRYGVEANDTSYGGNCTRRSGI